MTVDPWDDSGFHETRLFRHLAEKFDTHIRQIDSEHEDEWRDGMTQRDGDSRKWTETRNIVGADFDACVGVRPVGFSRYEKLVRPKGAQLVELALPKRLAFDDDCCLISAHPRRASAGEEDGAEWIVD